MLTTITRLAHMLAIYFKYIIVAVVSFLLGYGCYAIARHDLAILHSTTRTVPKVESSNEDSISHETNTITLKEKQRNTDPDLVVNNRYIAEVNGEIFEIPKESGKISLRDSKDSKGASLGFQTKVTSDINMTPIVRKMADLEYKRNWEVSAGIGRSHDGHFYVPIGLQRNYNYDRAIEVSIGLSKDHVENIQVVHKWKF